MRKLIYYFTRALRNMRQSLFLCTAAVSTVMVALAILAFFALVVLNIEQLTRNWSREVHITAYLDRSIPKETIKEKQQQLEAFPEVGQVVFTSKLEAYEQFKLRLGEDADLLKGLQKDFLPASFTIRLKDGLRNRNGIDKVVARLQDDSLLRDLRYGQDWLERFEAFLSLLHLAGMILGGFLLFAALFIVSNTIRLTLFARRDELEVMALVGGTPLFIKSPFLLEGALQGAAGGMLAVAASYGFFRLVLREDLTRLLVTSGVGQINFLPLSWQLMLVATGTLLGLVGSFMSLRKLVRS